MKWLWRSLAVFVGLIFIYSGAIKILDPIGFAGDIDNYHLVPWSVSAPLSFYLPWLEVFCGLALAFRRLYTGALSILIALILTFIGATLAARFRGIDITCGCFGHASKNSSFTSHLALDLLLLAGTVFLWREHSRNFTSVRGVVPLPFAAETK